MLDYSSGMSGNYSLASECWGIKQEHIVASNGAPELITAIMEKLEDKDGESDQPVKSIVT